MDTSSDGLELIHRDGDCRTVYEYASGAAGGFLCGIRPPRGKSVEAVIRVTLDADSVHMPQLAQVVAELSRLDRKGRRPRIIDCTPVHEPSWERWDLPGDACSIWHRRRAQRWPWRRRRGCRHYDHDKSGRLVATYIPGGPRAEFEYNERDQLATITTNWGDETCVLWGDDGRQVGLRDNHGNEARIEPDDAGGLRISEYSGPHLIAYTFSSAPDTEARPGAHVVTRTSYNALFGLAEKRTQL